MAMTSPTADANLFESTGNKSDEIKVKISHKIIQLFSEGLYSSPNKAIEELVANSFDADAKNVHVILSPDLRNPLATIVVIDDGEGMDAGDLKQHWIIGNSKRRQLPGANRRKPIGKFGIGKLSTFVLATKLTHISKRGNTYYAATMDYSRLGDTTDSSGGVFDDQDIEIPLRTLTEPQAKAATEQWTSGQGAGFGALKLFGPDAVDSWTISIMSGLKAMGQRIQIGRLKWVLSTAMPQLTDFHLFLDGAPITAPDLDKPVAKYIIGKDIVSMPAPFSGDLEEREDTSEPEDSVHRFGVVHAELLGRITGYIEIYEDELDSGKPKFEQSSGFFVYVRGRRVNVDDPGFGIERNLLRHGTFSRFRMVVHIDSLDDALRSSRESFQQGALYENTQNYLRAGFNYARNHLNEHDQKQSPAAKISARMSSAPGSMTRKPILEVARLVSEGKINPYYLRFPSGFSAEQWASFLESLEERLNETGTWIKSLKLEALDSKEGIAVLDVQYGKLCINSSHPFVAAFQEIFLNERQGPAFEMIVMAEILTEAHLYHMDMDEETIREVIGRRDELLRQFVRSSAHRTAGMIALGLIDARDDANRLEEEMRAAFEAMGFDNVIRIGGKGNPDGTAEAYLAAREEGMARKYKVGLEAKSGGKVSAKRLGVSGIARHMK